MSSQTNCEIGSSCWLHDADIACKILRDIKLVEYKIFISEGGMEIPCRHLLLVVVIVTTINLSLLMYMNEPVSPSERSFIWKYFRQRYTNLTHETITIQFRSDFFSSDPLKVWGRGRTPFTYCSVKNCLVLPMETNATADVLIFHCRNHPELPRQRLSRQKYLFFSKESEVHENPLPIIYNLTMTHRLDSDIPIPYGGFMKKGTENGQLSKYETNYARGKSKKVAWVVSNCHTHSKREQYVNELKKHIEIDIYGSCGSLSCDHTTCFTMINTTYKFFLAFENSICKDYITEKVFRILNYGGLVPVVLGGANYSRQLPPHSFIDAMDFPSPRALADHLHKLDSNDTLYDEYFRWKQDYVMLDWQLMAKKQLMCSLCKYLHANKDQTKVYNDIRQWFNPATRCRQFTWSTWHRQLLFALYPALVITGPALC